MSAIVWLLIVAELTLCTWLIHILNVLLFALAFSHEAAYWSYEGILDTHTL